MGLEKECRREEEEKKNPRNTITTCKTIKLSNREGEVLDEDLGKTVITTTKFR